MHPARDKSDWEGDIDPENEQERAGLKWFGVGTGTILIVLGCAYFYAIGPHHSSAPPESPAGLLERADELAWGNKWAEAQPLYAKLSSFSKLNISSLKLYTLR